MTAEIDQGSAGLGLRLGTIELESGLPPDALLDALYGLPQRTGSLQQQPPTTHSDSATFVYIDDPAAAKPSFGMVVVLIVPPASDAAAKVEEVRRARWGADDAVTITDRSGGTATEPAWVDFWRVFGPGQFVLPNQPVYFRIWYRSGEGYAFMIIGSTAANRELLTDAVIATLGRSTPGTPKADQ